MTSRDDITKAERFFEDMKNPDKQEKYKKFVEREQTAYKIAQMEDKDADV